MMPLQPTFEQERTRTDDGERGSPFLAFLVVLAGLIAIIALVSALSGDGGSDVNIDQPVPADAR